MRMADIQSVINQIPRDNVALKANKGFCFSIIVNESDNVGFDVSLYRGSFKVVKFKREPYRTSELMTGYENLTTKQIDKIRKHIIDVYFPELSYLIN